MTRLLRAFVVAVCGLLVAACTTTPDATLPPLGGTLALEEFFAGTTVGEGRAEADGVDRAFTVTSRGTWDGRTLTLHEDLRYADGALESRTWRFTKQRDGGFKGTREGIVGVAEAWQDGRTVRLSYSAPRTGRSGRTRTVRVETVLVAQSDTAVLEKTVVSRFGLAVDRVTVLYRRP